MAYRDTPNLQNKKYCYVDFSYHSEWIVNEKVTINVFMIRLENLQEIVYWVQFPPLEVFRK